MAAEDGPTVGGPMSESERLQRVQQNYCCGEDRDSARKKDKELAHRIKALLNHPDILEYSLVDAYYYDYATIPFEILDKEGFYRDMYLIYGITEKGELVSKWVGRYDLDSDTPVVNGCVEERK